MADEIFEQYPVGSWEVGRSGKLSFPILSVSEDGGNRIVERNRPYRDGAKLDDVGSKATRWTVEVLFNNGLTEPELDSTLPLYPDILNEVLDTFRLHGTGDLTLPTRGKVRARAESYKRSETNSDRDSATVSFVWVEDNEDAVDAQSFEAPTVNASAKRLTEEAEFSAQSNGMWNTSLADLREFGSQLEAIANFPGDTLGDLDNKAGIVLSTANSVINAFTSPRGLELLSDPENSSTQRKLEQTKELAAQARGQAGAGRLPIVAFAVDNATDLFTIAARLGQNPQDLLDINPGVNPLLLGNGTIVNVFDDA